MTLFRSSFRSIEHFFWKYICSELKRQNQCLCASVDAKLIGQNTPAYSAKWIVLNFSSFACFAQAKVFKSTIIYVYHSCSRIIYVFYWINQSLNCFISTACPVKISAILTESREKSSFDLQFCTSEMIVSLSKWVGNEFCIWNHISYRERIVVTFRTRDSTFQY